MTLVIEPGRTNTQRPGPGVEIDIEQGLGQGLLMAALLNERAGAPLDLAQCKFGTISGATWSIDGVVISGSSDYVDFGTDATVYQPTKFSVTFRFRSTGSLSGVSPIVSNYNLSGGGGGFEIRTNVSSGLDFLVTTTGGSSTTTATVNSLSSGVWYTVTATWDGTTANLYLSLPDNSAAMSTGSVAGALTIGYGTGSKMRFGQDTASVPGLACTIQYVFIHNYVLTKNQVIDFHSEPYSIFLAPALTFAPGRAPMFIGTFAATETLLSEPASRLTNNSRSVSEAALFGETAARSTTNSRAVTEAPFSQSASRIAAIGTRTAVNALLPDTASRRGKTPPSFAFEAALFTQTATRAPHTATRKVTEQLITENPRIPTVLTPATVTETLFSQSASRGAMVYVPRIAVNSTFLNDAVRKGWVTEILFSQTASRSSINRSRSALNTVLSDLASPAIRHIARTATDTIFTELAAGVAVITQIALPTAVDNRDPFRIMSAYLNTLATTLGAHMISAASLLKILDKVAASYRSNESQQCGNTLAQLQEIIVGDDGVSGTVYGCGDDAFILKMGTIPSDIVVAANPDTVNKTIYNPFLTALANYLISTAGGAFPSLDAYATAKNGITIYTFLVHPNLAYLQYLYNNKQGNLLMTPANVFAPLTTFGICTVGAGAGAVTYTRQTSIPTANVPGATPPTQGYTPAPGAKAVITVTINGTLTITVTANGQGASGNVFTGHTWTAVLDSQTANNAVALTPNVAGDRLSDITAVSGAGAATAGAFTLTSTLERTVS